MDVLERIVSANYFAAIKAGRSQPYVFWLADEQSVKKELRYFPRVRWTSEFKHGCEAWGTLEGVFDETQDRDKTARRIAIALLTKSKTQYGFTWDDDGILRVWRKH